MITVRNLVVVLLAVVSLNGSLDAQITDRVYQLSGLVVSQTSQEPVPFARISINKSRRGGFANIEGFYSIPVLESDTVYIGSLGYKSGRLVVKDYLEEYKGDRNSPYIYAINYLGTDSIVFPDQLIFPYNNASELRTALIETDVDEAIESINARENLNPDVMDVLIKNLSIDAGERVMVARQLYYNEQQQQGVAPTATLFDPIAVYQLLNYIHKKTKERRTKDLEYWPD